MIRKGDKVSIKPEWQDAGDCNFDWVAADDEQNGRVAIMPLGTGLAFAPVSIACVSMLVA